jgi:hypothetical protein
MPDSYTVVSTADPSRPGFYTYEQVWDEHPPLGNEHTQPDVIGRFPVIDTWNQPDMGPGWDPKTGGEGDVLPLDAILPIVDPLETPSLTALQIEQASDPYWSDAGAHFHGGHYHATLEGEGSPSDPYHHGAAGSEDIVAKFGAPRPKHVRVLTIGEDADALVGQLHLGGVDRQFHPITGVLLAADRLINVLTGGEDETVSARVGRDTYTGSGSNIIANVLDRIDPGHTFRAVANSPINRLPCVPASYARAIAKQIKCR